MNYSGLVKAINSASAELQGHAVVAVNQSLVVRNWLIGAYIVEFEQNGKERAKYGERLLEKLAGDLSERGLKGLNSRALRDCRTLYIFYPELRGTLPSELDSIRRPLDAKLISQAVICDLRDSDSAEIQSLVPIRRPLDAKLGKSPSKPAPKSLSKIRGPLDPELPKPFSPELLLRFSWAHYLQLIRIEDPWKRAFYENEILKGTWSKRQLQRQIGTLLYERTGLSKNKKAVIARAAKQSPQETIQDLIRDPYVLEFTGLAERAEYHESDLESALLNHLQSFLLELGEGFCFEARQRRITVGGKHDYIDLVFYHRRLRCHVLIDLKIRPFQHGDAGQMNFYLNWWKANAVEPGEQPPVGIILCSDREHTVVEFATAGLDNKLFVSRYLVALPSAEQLSAFLEADRARIESCIKPTVRKKAPSKKPPKKRPAKSSIKKRKPKIS